MFGKEITESAAEMKCLRIIDLHKLSCMIMCGNDPSLVEFRRCYLKIMKFVGGGVGASTSFLYFCKFGTFMEIRLVTKHVLKFRGLDFGLNNRLDN